VERSRGRKYYYESRYIRWKFKEEKDSDRWVVELFDRINLRVEEDISRITTSRESDVELGEHKRSEQVVNVTDERTGIEVPVKISRLPDLSTQVKSHFGVPHRFEAGGKYILEFPSFAFPPCMKKDADYLRMLMPVHTSSVTVVIELPSDFDLSDYGLDCYVMDLRLERVRNLKLQKNSVGKIVVMKDQGPFEEGETILFKYFRMKC